MPLSLIEAMAAGCPVVATTVGGIPDVMGDSHDPVGRLVPPKDPVQLARAIIEVLSNAELRRGMSTAARARVMAAFDVTICHQKTAEVYEAVSPSPLAGERRGGG
jgi:glycosyltransferase involved in cell wall biosynthesis